MAGETNSETKVWPLPAFRFSVNWNNRIIICQEVSGLEAETQVIEYREGNSPAFSPVKMPGIAKYGNVTLKKGVFEKDNQFFEWYNQIKMNTIQRSTVIIQLLDETGKPKIIWTLRNAWPVKISGPALKSDGNEVAIETIELAHEGFVISAQ